MSNSPSKEQLIDALYNEYAWLCHDDFNPDEDPTPEEYLAMLKEMSYDELVEEACADAVSRVRPYLYPTSGDSFVSLARKSPLPLAISAPLESVSNASATKRSPNAPT